MGCPRSPGRWHARTKPSPCNWTSRDHAPHRRYGALVVSAEPSIWSAGRFSDCRGSVRVFGAAEVSLLPARGGTEFHAWARATARPRSRCLMGGLHGLESRGRTSWSSRGPHAPSAPQLQRVSWPTALGPIPLSMESSRSPWREPRRGSNIVRSRLTGPKPSTCASRTAADVDSATHFRVVAVSSSAAHCIWQGR